MENKNFISVTNMHYDSYVFGPTVAGENSR